VAPPLALRAALSGLDLAQAGAAVVEIGDLGL
jgi:hypothetical protein